MLIIRNGVKQRLGCDANVKEKQYTINSTNGIIKDFDNGHGYYY